MSEVKLRQERIQAIELVDSASASLSEHHLTISRLYKLGSDEERFDFLLFNLEEAKELRDFLNENLGE